MSGTFQCPDCQREFKYGNRRTHESRANWRGYMLRKHKCEPQQEKGQLAVITNVLVRLQIPRGRSYQSHHDVEGWICGACQKGTLPEATIGAKCPSCDAEVIAIGGRAPAK